MNKILPQLSQKDNQDAKVVDLKFVKKL